MSTDSIVEASRSNRLQLWERRSEWPLAVAALVFLGCYSWLILQPHLARPLRHALEVIDYATWFAFVVDYVARLLLAAPRIRWFVRNLPELLIVGLPVLRPLRLLRLVALIRVLNGRATASVHGRVGVYVATTSVFVVYSGALAELSAERGARGANIETFGSAIWWAVTTVTTVGYGDYYPVTTEGRFVAAAMMIAGVALIGTVTASIASYLVGRVRAASSMPQPNSNSDGDIAAMRADLAALSALLRASRTDPE